MSDQHNRRVTTGATIALLAAGLLLTASTAAAATRPAARHGTAKPVTLTMWDTLNADTTGIPKSNYWETRAIDMFEQQHPNIRVKIVPTPGDATDAFSALLKSSEVAGNTPDIGQLFPGGQILQNTQYLLPLNKYLTPKFTNSLYPTVGWQMERPGYATNGPIYGVPYGAGAYYFVYYNKALFKKAGVTITDTSYPTTWSQLVLLAKHLKAKGILPFQFGEEQGYFGAWTQDALISHEVGTAGLLNFYDGKTSLDTPAIIKAYTAWHELYADGLTNKDALSTNNSQSWAQFAKGNGAMTITLGQADGAVEVGAMKNNIGIFPVPALPGSKYPTAITGGPTDAYVIFKNTKHPLQAITFIQFMLSTPVQVMYMDQGYGELPNVKTYKLTARVAHIDPVLSQTYYWILVRKFPLELGFDSVMPETVLNYWYHTNAAVFGGSMTPAAAARGLEQQMKTYLATSA